MKESREPERTCLVCRKKAAKSAFIKVVRNKEGIFSVDNTYKKDGRGVYICNEGDCVYKAVKTRALNRAFKTVVENQIYEELVNGYEHKQD